MGIFPESGDSLIVGGMEGGMGDTRVFPANPARPKELGTPETFEEFETVETVETPGGLTVKVVRVGGQGGGRRRRAIKAGAVTV